MWQSGVDGWQVSVYASSYFMRVNTLFAGISVHCVQTVPEESRRDQKRVSDTPEPMLQVVVAAVWVL